MSFQLKPPAFAYLLSILKAKGVIGLDDPIFFPQTSAEYHQILSQGYDQLLEKGYLVADTTHHNQYQINELLLLLVADIAQPDQVVITKTQTHGKLNTWGLHYFAAQDIVELGVGPEGAYEISLLEGQNEWATRLSQFIGLPDRAESHLTAFTATQDFLEAAKNARTSELEFMSQESVTLSASAQAFLACCARPHTIGQIFVVRSDDIGLHGRQFDLFIGQNDAWLAQRQSRDTAVMRFEPLSHVNLPQIL